jgi:hypothetical protein
MTDHSSSYCCDRFEDCVRNDEIKHAGQDDETEWYIPNWHHLYYCPFCGAYVGGKGFGTPEKKLNR